MAYTKEQRAAKAAQTQAGGETKKVSPSVSTEIKTTKSSPVKLSLDMLVRVVNGHNGRLIYKSKKNTGYKEVFERFGDFAEMELGELLTAKNTQPKFFKNNWFLIEDLSVLEYLRVGKFYENALTEDDFESIFERSDLELTDIISKLSNGQKNTLTNKAKEMIDTKEIDSLKKIEALEKALGTKLTEV